MWKGNKMSFQKLRAKGSCVCVYLSAHLLASSSELNLLCLTSTIRKQRLTKLRRGATQNIFLQFDFKLLAY